MYKEIWNRGWISGTDINKARTFKSLEALISYYNAGAMLKFNEDLVEVFDDSNNIIAEYLKTETKGSHKVLREEIEKYINQNFVVGFTYAIYFNTHSFELNARLMYKEKNVL